jgi:hypothetical protein
VVNECAPRETGCVWVNLIRESHQLLGAVPPREGSGVKYGAIGFSVGTNDWGDSYRYGSRAEAERRALPECAKNARDCRVGVWFNDNCCAVASVEGGIWASGLGRSEAAAMNDAIADRGKRGGKKCEMQRAVCSRWL